MNSKCKTFSTKIYNIIFRLEHILLICKCQFVHSPVFIYIYQNNSTSICTPPDHWKGVTLSRKSNTCLSAHFVHDFPQKSLGFNHGWGGWGVGIVLYAEFQWLENSMKYKDKYEETNTRVLKKFT